MPGNYLIVLIGRLLVSKSLHTTSYRSLRYPAFKSLANGQHSDWRRVGGGTTYCQHIAEASLVLKAIRITTSQKEPVRKKATI